MAKNEESETGGAKGGPRATYAEYDSMLSHMGAAHGNKSVFVPGSGDQPKKSSAAKRRLMRRGLGQRLKREVRRA